MLPLQKHILQKLIQKPYFHFGSYFKMVNMFSEV